MKLDNEELVRLHDKAERAALSMSDFLRTRSGFSPLRRGVGRPGLKVRCPIKGCGAMVSATQVSKHVREVHPRG
jgi:hypothetical protein